MNPIIEPYIEEVRALCREYGVRRLDLFGSATTGAFDEQRSDLDFIADFADRSPGYADRYLGFTEALEALLGRRVDVLTERGIKSPRFRQSVEETRQNVFNDGQDTRTAA